MPDHSDEGLRDEPVQIVLADQRQLVQALDGVEAEVRLEHSARECEGELQIASVRELLTLTPFANITSTSDICNSGFASYSALSCSLSSSADGPTGAFSVYSSAVKVRMSRTS